MQSSEDEVRKLGTKILTMFLVMTFGQLARQTRFYGTIFRQSFLLFFLLWPASFQNLEEQHWRNGDPTVTWEKC